MCTKRAVHYYFISVLWLVYIPFPVPMRLLFLTYPLSVYDAGLQRHFHDGVR